MGLVNPAGQQQQQPSMNAARGRLPQAGTFHARHPSANGRIHETGPSGIPLYFDQAGHDMPALHNPPPAKRQKQRQDPSSLALDGDALFHPNMNIGGGAGGMMGLQPTTPRHQAQLMDQGLFGGGGRNMGQGFNYTTASGNSSNNPFGDGLDQHMQSRQQQLAQWRSRQGLGPGPGLPPSSPTTIAAPPSSSPVKPQSPGPTGAFSNLWSGLSGGAAQRPPVPAPPQRQQQQQQQPQQQASSGPVWPFQQQQQASSGPVRPSQQQQQASSSPMRPFQQPVQSTHGRRVSGQQYAVPRGQYALPQAQGQYAPLVNNQGLYRNPLQQVQGVPGAAPTPNMGFSRQQQQAMQGVAPMPNVGFGRQQQQQGAQGMPPSGSNMPFSGGNTPPS